MMRFSTKALKGQVKLAALKEGAMMTEMPPVGQASLQKALSERLNRAKTGEELYSALATAEKDGWRSNYLSYMAALERARAWKDTRTADQLIERMRGNTLHVDTAAHNILLDVYARQGDVDGLRKARKAMARDGAVMDASSFAAVAHGLARVDQHAEALAIIDEMKDAGLGAAAASPGVWNAMLAGHAAHERMERMLDTLRIMENQGVEPDAHSYTLLVRVFVHKRFFDRALEMIETMWERELPRPHALYVDLLDGMQNNPRQADPPTLMRVLSLLEQEGATKRDPTKRPLKE